MSSNSASTLAEEAARLDRQIAALEAAKSRIRHTRIDYVFPDTGPFRRELYPKHIEFLRQGKDFRERAFIAANRVGKSDLAAYEMSCHLTGRYPPWWEGRRFTQPIEAWAAGTTNQTTRDIVQAKLLGAVGDEGTGMIPAADIVSSVNRAGIPGAVDTAFIRHVSGGRSRLGLKSFEQRRKSFEGTGKHVIWLDEEPEQEIYVECLVRTATTKGILLCTFTPLEGWSEVVKSFIEPADGAKRFWIQAGWEDCPHLDEAAKKELLASIQPYQREARTKGTPSLGSGAIYPVAESDITVSPFEIPKHWPRAYGMDVGWNRTAVVWGARDPEDGTVYVYSEYYVGSEKPPMHAMGVKARGEWIPGVIDPAANGRSQRDGEQLMAQYRELGLKLHPADNTIDTGIYEVWTLFSSGQLKIFTSCVSLLSEFRKYRRDERGRIVKADDHACFVAGTMIRTPDGTRAVESLAAGDLVSTPLGTAMVLATAAREAETVAWNGTRVTPEHPVWTAGNKWKRVDALRYDDEVCEWSPSFSTASFSGDIPIPGAPKTATTSSRVASTFSAGWRVCTAKYGSRFTAPFRTVSTSITRIATSHITRLTTTNCCRPLLTSPFTWKAGYTTSITWPEYALSPKSGTLLRRDFSGIPSTERRSSAASPPDRTSAGTAGIRLNPARLTHRVLCFVLTLAKRLPGADRVWTMSPALARAAAGVFASTSIRSGHTAADPALTVAKVFRLRTEHGCYFANDVLVSNCDALRYLIMSGRNRMIPHPAPKRVVRESAPGGDRGWMS